MIINKRLGVCFIMIFMFLSQRVIDLCDDVDEMQAPAGESKCR